MSLNINPRNHVPCCNSFVFIMCYVQSVQKYCFPLSNMQICGVFVAVVVVVAKGPSKRLQHLLQHPFDFVEWQC